MTRVLFWVVTFFSVFLLKSDWDNQAFESVKKSEIVVGSDDLSDLWLELEKLFKIG